MNTKQWTGVVAGILIVGGIIWALAAAKPATDKAASSPTTAATATPSPAGSAATTASAQPSATSAVTISGYAYAPATLTIKKGTTVTWTNQDDVRHDVALDDGQPSGGPAGPLLAKGKSYSFTFNTVGTYKYHCSPHPFMKATVIVTE
jgi:amicyanin